MNPFLKIFSNPVENTIQPSQGGLSQISYQNAKSAINGGFELEARTNFAFMNRNNKFLENLLVFGNFSYIYSAVDQSNITTIAEDVKNRPLQGQSPYVINTGINYTNPDKGTSVTLSFNRIGRRLWSVGTTGATGNRYLEIWEGPRSVLDIQLSQKVFKNGEIKLKALRERTAATVLIGIVNPSMYSVTRSFTRCSML